MNDIIEMVEISPNQFAAESESKRKMPKDYGDYLKRFLLPKMQSDAGKQLVNGIIEKVKLR